MITENSNSENEDLKPSDEIQNSAEHQNDVDTQKSVTIPEEKVLSEIDETKEEKKIFEGFEKSQSFSPSKSSKKNFFS